MFFSPLRDQKIPENISGLIFGGGYPELNCKELSENNSMRRSVKDAIRSGMPCLAECGGFMYLHEEMEDERHIVWEMAGVLNGRTYPAGKLVRFGYVELSHEKEQKESCYLKQGEVIKGHEFHYWDSSDNGEGLTASEAGSKNVLEMCSYRRQFVCGVSSFIYAVPVRSLQSVLQISADCLPKKTKQIRRSREGIICQKTGKI